MQAAIKFFNWSENESAKILNPLRNNILKFFGWYVPNEFTEILNSVQNNTLTDLIINTDLINKFDASIRYVFAKNGKEKLYDAKKIPRRFRLLKNKQSIIVEEQLRLLGEALRTNTSVVSVVIAGRFPFLDWLFDIISAFKVNKTIRNLMIDADTYYDGAYCKLFYLADMLKVNKGLKKLIINCDDSYSDDESRYICSIVEALKVNKTLEILGLNNPSALNETAIHALSTLSTFNNTLRKISLYRYGRTLRVDDQPMRELINRSWQVKSIRFFYYLPGHVIEKIDEYLKQEKVLLPQAIQHL